MTEAQAWTLIAERISAGGRTRKGLSTEVFWLRQEQHISETQQRQMYARLVDHIKEDLKEPYPLYASYPVAPSLCAISMAALWLAEEAHDEG